MEFNYEDILTRLMYLAGDETQITSILITGSNHDLSSKNTIAQDSDIDFIVLNENRHFSIKNKVQNISYDISFINQNDITSIILGALNGSSFFGKVFSSINNCNVIKDTNDQGVRFINTITFLYTLFSESFIPNFETSSISLHNISANKKDLRKNTFEENYFATLRLSEHVFNYMSHLAYPMYTSGSYRGKIIKQQFGNFNNKENNNCLIHKDDILMATQKISPVLAYKFFGVVENEIIQSAISNNEINSYYYGYNNLVEEKRIVFLLENDILKNNLKLTDLNNIVPFLTEEELTTYTDFLISLSTKHQRTLLKNRIQLLLEIFNIFRKEKLHQVIIKTLKSLMILKSVYFLSKKENQITMDIFSNWLINLKEGFHIPEILNLDINFENILSIVINSTSRRETEIKTCHIFFGIMKSLKIDMEDLNFGSNP